MNLSLKTLSTIINAIAFVCAVLLIVNKTYGYQKEIRIGFYLFGAAALIVGFFNAKNDEKQAFNPLFWIGTLVLFIGLVIKTSNLPYAYFVLIAGGFITGASYMFNPFTSKVDDDSDLLDN